MGCLGLALALLLVRLVGGGLHVSLFDLMLQKRNSLMSATKARKESRAEGEDGAGQTAAAGGAAAAAVPLLPAWGGATIPPAAAALNVSGGGGGDKGGGLGGLGVSPAGPAAVAGTSPAAVAAAVLPAVAVKSLKEIQAKQEQQKLTRWVGSIAEGRNGSCSCSRGCGGVGCGL